MNQGPRRISLIEKKEGQQSRGTIPLSHCGVIPVQSFGSHILPQPHGLGLIAGQCSFLNNPVTSRVPHGKLKSPLVSAILRKCSFAVIKLFQTSVSVRGRGGGDPAVDYRE